MPFNDYYREKLKKRGKQEIIKNEQKRGEN